jgi:glucose-1-phosphate thymidylyltransferase
MKYPNNHIAATAKVTNSVIIPPCYIGDGAVVDASVVGPHVSVGAHTKLHHSVVKNSILRDHSILKEAMIDNSLVGSYVHYKGGFRDLSMGDYTTES